MTSECVLDAGRGSSRGDRGERGEWHGAMLGPQTCLRGSKDAEDEQRGGH